MKKVKDLFLRLRQIKGLKYIVVSVLALLFIGFIDDDSVWHHIQNQQRINELQSEIDTYRDQYEHNMSQIKMLDTDQKAIQKIARERYFMKADGEDIFVLSDDAQDFQNLNADESAE